MKLRKTQQASNFNMVKANGLPPRLMLPNFILSNSVLPSSNPSNLVPLGIVLPQEHPNKPMMLLQGLSIMVLNDILIL